MKLAAILLALIPLAAQAQATLPTSTVYPYDHLTPKKSPNGTESRPVLSGTLLSGEAVGLHESMQPAHAEPVPLHVIQHSEIIMVQEGTLGFEHDGKTEIVTAGGTIYVALGTLHRLKNMGEGPARYFVVQIGGDTKK
ncbi:cupin domain-containing protein [Granulicella tundricola]|uniref:Cupin 2 conserved barrel domain protein n=1 Tax=Granulicella tundricola (strain ATCC BAA-1859 / DSM 23138 / MP5ACTX9) TaxID=1198114 RepID=E8WV97_GRATM|nr:cupin domain-containing protein [Granulicella tundricola]ADW67272.1 Cupin 2 conserved barrel domain protein [Granulicella tundricola MP5ACTX9]